MANIQDGLAFWNTLSKKVKSLIKQETSNCFKCARYDVTTAPNGSTIGVTLPLGTTEIQIPYSQEVSDAEVGETVIVVWYGSLSNAKAYYYGNGYEGTSGGGGGGSVSPSTSNPLMDGTASAGSSNKYSRGDHRHPTDTSRAPVDSPTLTGTPRSTTPSSSDNSTRIATTAFVQAVAGGGGGGGGGGSTTDIGFVTPQDYGAVGDGETIDTQAIQDAIDDARLNGLDVYFPTGTYLIDDTIDCTNVSLFGHVHLDSNGYNATGVVIKASTADGMLLFTSETSTDVCYPSIRNIVLDGANAAAYCLSLVNREVFLQHVYCCNGLIGLKLDRVYNGLFERCVFNSNVRYGIYMQTACNNLMFLECLCGGNSKDLVTAYANVYANNPTPAYESLECSNIKFIACELDPPVHSGAYDFDLNYCCVLTFDQNYIEGSKAGLFNMNHINVFNFTNNYVIDADIDFSDTNTTGTFVGNSFKVYNKNAAEIAITMNSDSIIKANYYGAGVTVNGGGGSTGIKTVEHQQTVAGDDNYRVWFETAIPASTPFTVINRSSTTAFTIKPISASHVDGEDITDGGLDTQATGTYTINYDIVGFLCYVNSTDFNFSLSYASLDTVVSHQATVQAESTQTFTLTGTIESGTTFTVKNKSSSSAITVCPIATDDTVLPDISGSGLGAGESVCSKTTYYDIKGFRCYVSSTDFNISVSAVMS